MQYYQKHRFEHTTKENRSNTNVPMKVPTLYMQSEFAKLRILL